jgi:acyl-CoA synthetase (AMP-forming)/AMP-acid ligase II
MPTSIAAPSNWPMPWRFGGFGPGDRIATLAWNGYRHMELYYGVSGMGAVLHTINPRLFPEQIEYIVNHAEDQFLFFDLSFVPLVERLAKALPTVRGFRRDDRPRTPAGVQHSPLVVL